MKKENNDTNHIFAGASQSSGLITCAAVAAALAACILLFHFLYEPMVTSSPVFDDLIIEATAQSGFNKAAEIRLFNILAAIGAAVITAIVFLPVLFSGKNDKDTVTGSPVRKTRKIAISHITPLLFITPAVIYLAISGIFSLPLFFLAGFSAIMIPVSERYGKDHLLVSLLPVLSYYSVLGILEAVSLFIELRSIGNPQLYAASAIITAASATALCLLSEQKGRLVLSIIQLPVPLIMTVYLRDKYTVGGETVRVPYAAGYYVIIYLIMIIMYALLTLNIYNAGKKTKSSDSAAAIPPLISAVTPAVIFAYQSWQACPVFAQPDQHHHGEQLIPWQQIITLGQRPYDEYTPVSGLFPMVNGFLQHVLLGGTVSDYAPAISLTTLIFSLITMILVCRHITAKKALIFACLFAIPSYNRQYMVLPLLLVFFLPSLMEKRGLWLKLWLFLCFLAGLYYPLFGAALLLGTLPLCILQLTDWFRKKEYLKDLKKPLPFILSWAAVLLPVILCLPMLIRMAVHTLTYSSQTILADGITLAGQTPPESFMYYLEEIGQGGRSLRQSFYLIYRFFLPLLWLFIPWGIIACLLSSQYEAAKIISTSSAGKNGKPGLIRGYLRSLPGDGSSLIYPVLSCMITLAVSYSYTLVRADVNVILARTGPVLVSAGMFLGICTLRCLYDTADKPDTADTSGARVPGAVLIAVAALSVSLPFMIYARVNDMKNPYLWTYPNGNEALVFSDASKLFTQTEVPEGFMYLSDVPIRDTSHLGNGFMVADQVPYLVQYDRVKDRLYNAGFEDVTYMGYDGQGFYYYMGTRACATGYLPVARSRRAQEEILSVAKKKHPVIFRLDPQKSFYIYRWILSDEAGYIYCAEDDCFYPAQIYKKLAAADPLLPPEGDDPSACDMTTDFGRVCESFGASADTLLGSVCGIAFKDPQAKADLCVSSGSLEGRQYELLYLPLDKGRIISAAGTDISKLRITFHTSSSSFKKQLPEGDVFAVECLIGDSSLLIPMGMNTAWETGIVSDISFSFLDENNSPVLIKSPGEISDLFIDQLAEKSGYYCISDRR